MLEDPSAQRVVELYDGILKSRGRALSPASVILDYGCGSGRHAYEFLDAGFPHVSGYDVQDYVKLRSPADASASASTRHPATGPNIRP